MSHTYDLICLSHLRWDFVYQRPQHLMGRCAREHRVFFVEEPVWDAEMPWLDVSTRPEGVTVLVAHLPPHRSEEEDDVTRRQFLDDFMRDNGVTQYVLWYYTPMMLPWTQHLTPRAVVYDCMDELSGFAGAPPVLREREAELFRRADLVFTGGQHLYEAKRAQHPAVYAFPSSVDVAHFAQARAITDDPDDQRAIPHPRLGFYGVIDERMDVGLMSAVADLRPDWQWILLGPTVPKIDPATLPKQTNVHYPGLKTYAELPAYLAGWDVALLPFARNDATRFISPTKTPEYLAAGRPVVSTSIRDVIRPYGEMGLARIADAPEDFVAACDAAMREDAGERQRKADAFLAQSSWDKTWGRMSELIDTAVASRMPPG